MANYRAVANGNWSVLTTWQDNSTGSFVASTVLPGAADDVYSNNFTVTIDQNATILSLRNTSATGITAGGRFLLTNGITVNATGTGLVAVAVLIEFNLAAPNSATVNCTLLNSTGAGVTGVTHSGTGTLNFNGNFQISAGGGILFNFTGNGILNVTGNAIFADGTGTRVFEITGVSSVFNWIGNMPTNYNPALTIAFIKGSGTNGVAGTINVTGNIYAGASGGNGIFTNGICNVTGIVGPTNSNTGTAIIGGAASIITINGIATSNNNRNLAISSTGLTTITGQVICVNESAFPVQSTRLRLANATPTQITFQTDLVGVNKTLYEPGTALGNPATTDVRDGVSYASGALTGTLIVPNPADVRKSVPTDNTIGTADLTAQDIFDAIAASSDPVAVRLRNCATVATTGDQIAAFNS